MLGVGGDEWHGHPGTRPAGQGSRLGAGLGRRGRQLHRRLVAAGGDAAEHAGPEPASQLVPAAQVPPAQAGSEQGVGGQLTAFCTRAPILASSAAVSSDNAKLVGHMAPSSRFALSLKPSVAYLALNFSAGWKKQTTLSSLA